MYVSNGYLMHVSNGYLMYVSIWYLMYVYNCYLMFVSSWYLMYVSNWYLMYVSNWCLIYVSDWYLIYVSNSYLISSFGLWTLTHILLMTSKFCICSPSSSRLPHHDIQWSGVKRASISINKFPGMAESLIYLLLIKMNCQHFVLLGV
jgi:hypothetical protein